MQDPLKIELSKPQRRLLQAALEAKKHGKGVERKHQDTFDLLQFNGLITSDGKITPSGEQWLKDNANGRVDA